MFKKIARDFIAQHEGFRANIYVDQAGHKTIGFGHKLKPGEEHARFLWPIDLAQAEALLDDDMRPAISAVRRFVTVPLNDNQRAALISFVFNVGRNNFGKSTMLAKLNAGDYAGAAEEFPRWRFVTNHRTGEKFVSSGLVKRRAAEKALFERKG